MSSNLPDSNNVYSTIASPVDLKLAESLLIAEFPEAEVRIYTSGFNGVKTLRVRSESADLDGYPLTEDINPDYLFNGGLAGNDIEVIAKVSSIYDRFIKAGLRISIEAYGSDDDLICSFPEKVDSSS